MGEDRKIRILVTDDHHIIRKSLRGILQSRPGLEVVAEAENGQVAIEVVKELCPDIVLMDVSMPVLGGIEATREVKKLCRDIIVIALSMHSDDYHIKEMMSAGAEDYVSKSAGSLDIERAIRQAVSRRFKHCSTF